MVALVVAGMLLDGGGDGGDEAASTTTSTSRTSTSRRPRPSTTTTVFVPTGPVLPVQTGALLVAAAGNGWTVVDLDTGARREVLATLDEVYSIVPVRDGVVGIRSGEAIYVPLRGDGRQEELGRADYVTASGRSDAVWLVAYDGDTRAAHPPPARLVDLDGRELQEVELLSPDIYGGTPDGVLVVGGGRVYLATEEGLRSMAIGSVLASNGREVLVHECDERGACRLVRVDLRSGGRTELPSFDMPVSCCAYNVVLGPTGGITMLTWEEDGLVIDLVAPDGRHAHGRYASEVFGGGEPVLLPDDLGFLLVGTDGELLRVTMVDDEVRTETVPGLAGVAGGGMERRLVLVP